MGIDDLRQRLHLAVTDPESLRSRPELCRALHSRKLWMPDLHKEHGHRALSLQGRFPAKVEAHGLPGLEGGRLLGAGHRELGPVLGGDENADVGVRGAYLHGLLLAGLEDDQPGLAEAVRLDVGDLLQRFAGLRQALAAARALLRALQQRRRLLRRSSLLEQRLRRVLAQLLGDEETVCRYDGLGVHGADVEQGATALLAFADVQQGPLRLLSLVDRCHACIQGVQGGVQDLEPAQLLIEHWELLLNLRQVGAGQPISRDFIPPELQWHLLLLVHLLQYLLDVALHDLPASPQRSASL
mmetsp:Transcript_20797/g.64989  ORF Transcript_20797/g.64989 Transcript_20797/m.64989 type:complete len:298 (+) Transcript_20797:1002-1895(+)